MESPWETALSTHLLDALVQALPGSEDTTLSRYRQQPAAFVEQVLGQTLWAKQAEALTLLCAHERVTIRSSHGVGKTFLAACAALWWVYCHKPSLVLTTAPTQRQVEGLLWGEINRLWRQALVPLPGRCMMTKIALSEDQLALGLTTREPERFAGWHNEHILVIVDEASGVPDAIYEVVQGTLTSAHNRLLLIGNPTQARGYFHSTHHSEQWQKLKVAAHDTPNFAAGLPEGAIPAPWLVTPDWVAARKAEWGEDSDPYRVRVLGEFPRQSADQLIALEWVEAAEERGPTGGAAACTLALDVARYGDCESVLAVRQGDALIALESWQGADLMQSTGHVIAAAHEHQARSLTVDAVGMGAGVFDRLQELKKEGALAGVTLTAFESGRRAHDKERYGSRRDEAYWTLRTRLKDGEIAFAQRWGKLTGQLCNLRYHLTSRGLIQIESKDELRRRRLPSPDYADAVMMAFAGPPPPLACLPRAIGGRRDTEPPLPPLNGQTR